MPEAQPKLETTMRLLGPREYVNLNEDLATGRFADGSGFRIGMSVNRDALYVFTKYRHPQDLRTYQIWAIPFAPVLEVLYREVEKRARAWSRSGFPIVRDES